ncbi:GRAS transcription factor [Rhynchospora pubera]|uniref:GRAS transcription factor n=1 Tax=Rhynchospora pubera TaxID=906938 RepID=A0AAV8F694_9POAL|nr:GRAS transcription factor [Rhynchospora pubera]
MTEGNSFEIVPKIDPYNRLVSEDYPDIALNATLSYLSQILMEEDIDEKDILYTKQSALHAMEKPFYEIIGQKYPPSPTEPQPQPQLLNHKKSTPGSTSQHFLNQLGSTSGILTTECGLKGKNKSNGDLDLLEGRNRKIAMSNLEEPLRNAMFDEVLLDHDPEVTIVQEHNANICSEQGQVESADFKALLIQCSHAVSENDRHLAENLINQIRKLSSLDGDWAHRVAYVFADALEARLNGTGSEAWRRIVAKRIPASEYLKVAQLYVTVCPFARISMYYGNQTILNVVGNAPKLHISDFGIGLGFQWPSLIQALSNKSDKPTKLRITGIDFPQSGFRPTELVQETGRRLEAYAETFNVPFEYQGIASNWESVSIDDLKIDRNEVLIVYTMYRFREVGDESVALDSPRDRVLNLIRLIRPHIFIEGILSITPFSPFFISRFRQCLFLYSSIFEILDILVPRDNKQTQIIE